MFSAEKIRSDDNYLVWESWREGMIDYVHYGLKVEVGRLGVWVGEVVGR